MVLELANLHIKIIYEKTKQAPQRKNRSKNFLFFICGLF